MREKRWVRAIAGAIPAVVLAAIAFSDVEVVRADGPLDGLLGGGSPPETGAAQEPGVLDTAASALAPVGDTLQIVTAPLLPAQPSADDGVATAPASPDSAAVTPLAEALAPVTGEVVPETVQTVAEPIVEALEPVTATVAPVAEAVGSVVNEAIVPAVEPVLAPVAAVVAPVVEDVVAAVERIAGPIVEAIEPAAGTLAPVAAVVTPAVDSVLSPIVAPILAPVADAISPVIEAVVLPVVEPVAPVMGALFPVSEDTVSPVAGPAADPLRPTAGGTVRRVEPATNNPVAMPAGAIPTWGLPAEPAAAPSAWPGRPPVVVDSPVPMPRLPGVAKAAVSGPELDSGLSHPTEVRADSLLATLSGFAEPGGLLGETAATVRTAADLAFSGWNPAAPAGPSGASPAFAGSYVQGSSGSFAACLAAAALAAVLLLHSARVTAHATRPPARSYAPVVPPA